jgi:hypothetical protein
VQKLLNQLVCAAILITTAACSSGELPIAGQVLVDGAPMDSGTLRLEPVDGESNKGAGGMVEGGTIQMPAGHGLTAGRYRVAANAFKKTGRTVQDYQRGAVEEMVSVQLRDSPQEIELSHDNAGTLSIEFHSLR